MFLYYSKTEIDKSRILLEAMWTISADYYYYYIIFFSLAFLVLFSKEIHTIIREILETEIEDTGYILFLVHSTDSMNNSNKYLHITDFITS